MKIEKKNYKTENREQFWFVNNGPRESHMLNSIETDNDKSLYVDSSF